MKRDEGNQTGNNSADGNLWRLFPKNITLVILICFMPVLLTGAGGKMKDMSFDEFREYLNHECVDEFEAFFDGLESPAPVTGNRYIFLQIVTYCGEGDVMSSYRTWNSNDDFFLIYKDVRVKLKTPDVRTFIDKSGSFSEKDIDTGRMLPSIEFGLIKNKKYYAKVSSEEYHLPPDSESGVPRQKTNHVLWISSRPFECGKPQIELTPLYKGWSY